MPSSDLQNHQDWVYADITSNIVASGNGIDSLVAALPDNNVGFASFRLQANMSGTDVAANVVLQWQGYASSPMNRNKSENGVQHALDVLCPNKGYIKVLGKNNLNTDNIYDRWRPGSASRVISD